jgi:hypothetical protein
VTLLKVHVTLLEVHVTLPEVHVTLLEVHATQTKIHVRWTEVHVTPPEVHVMRLMVQVAWTRLVVLPDRRDVLPGAVLVLLLSISTTRAAADATNPAVPAPSSAGVVLPSPGFVFAHPCVVLLVVGFAMRRPSVAMQIAGVVSAVAVFVVREPGCKPSAAGAAMREPIPAPGAASCVMHEPAAVSPLAGAVMGAAGLPAAVPGFVMPERLAEVGGGRVCTGRPGESRPAAREARVAAAGSCAPVCQTCTVHCVDEVFEVIYLSQLRAPKTDKAYKMTRKPSFAATNVRLGDCCDVYIGRLRAGNTEREATNVRLVRGADLFRGALNSQQLEAQPVPGVIPDNLRIRPGDILMPGVTRRPCARLVGSELAGCFAHHTINIIRPRPGSLDGRLLADYLSSSDFLIAASKYACTVSGAWRLTASALLDISFVVPLEEKSPGNSIISLMDQLARNIIRVIAQNGGQLRHVEWRDLERVLATVFDGLGFDAELTPSSKDGGKDIILTCIERGARRQYVVEVKHWVSGKAVGGSYLKKFLDVIVSGKHDAGLFLSTSGFARNAQESVEHFEHRRMRVGGADKVIRLCQMFVLGESGLWLADRSPTTVLFDSTVVPFHSSGSSNGHLRRRYELRR